MTHEFVSSDQDMEIVLNNVPLRTLGPIGFDLVNLYGRKTHHGDPQPNDHPTDSTISQQDHQGGIGTLVYEGDEDRGNSWFSTAWMQTSKMLSLPPRTDDYSVTGEFGNTYIHDKFGAYQIFSFGRKVKRWNEITKNIEDPTAAVTLGADPIGRGVTWGDQDTAKKLYIPCGSTYEVFDGTARVAGTAGEKALSFVVWSEKLFKIDEDGVLKMTTDGAVWTVKGKIPDSSSPRKLFVFYDNGGNTIVHVATSASVYALDFPNNLLIETDLTYPDHPYQGLGATRWRADAYISVGIGVHRNAKGLITAMGPDGRDGLPLEYASGYFTDLCGSYNELFGLIAGGEIAAAVGTEAYDNINAPPEPMYGSATPRFSMLLGYTGLGWHPRWIGTKMPTNIGVSSSMGVYRVFWGDAGTMHTQVLPVGYYNPAYLQQKVPLARYARHETPWYNWGMIDTPKILKYFETHTSGCDENNYIKIWVRVDNNDEESDESEPQWGDGTTSGSPLAIITTNGQHRFLTGYEEFGDRLLHAGLTHEKVQFAFEFFGDESDEFSTPSMDWYTIVGRKWMRTVRVFTFQVDATLPHKGLSTHLISQHLYNTARKKGGVPLVIANRVFMVDVTADSGNVAAGLTWEAYHNVSCIEMIEEDNE